MRLYFQCYINTSLCNGVCHIMNKIIVRIKGGLGNQLFCYAAARRLALDNNAELVIDDVTGFARDYEYHRKCSLDNFRIPARKATRSENLEPFERYRRGIKKWLSRRKPYHERNYLEQDGPDFDERLLELKISGTVYLDGLWQSENYFKDVESIIREDLRIIQPTDALNQCLANKIRNCNSVAIHVRWFGLPGSSVAHNVSKDYYKIAIALMDEQVVLPHYFLFSDNPDAVRSRLELPENRVTFVSHNRDENNSYADLWLMSLCKYFIIANSTFSWWGAWLAEQTLEKKVFFPRVTDKIKNNWSWDYNGQMPDSWQPILL